MHRYILLLSIVPAVFAADASLKSIQAHTTDGVVEGVVSADGKVSAFKGIPFAAPPVGPLRWKEPQPVQPWTGVRQAKDYSSHCMQLNVFGDMIFRDPGASEDCLYLNVWAPANAAAEKLPVMVWIYGGGFVAGATSEPRQDGGNLSKQGVVVVSMNYRLGIFGFFSHPELTKESGHNASGNYGLMDQTAALRWVHNNIAQFGGDPANVTIFGESAGSFSVSAQMASPLAQGLFRRAIGESGAFFGSTLHARPLGESEKTGQHFAETALGAKSLDDLRALPAEKILQATKGEPFRWGPNVDGYFLPESVASIYAAGKQSRIPLLAGWNLDEGSYQQILGKDPPTPENYAKHIREHFGKHADAILKLYPAETEEQVKRAAGDLAGAQFIAYGTWKWLDEQLATGLPVYRYEFDDALPAPAGKPEEARGAYHSGEIEFVFGVLSSKDLPWRPEDRKLSEQMSAYWANFAKTGDPNGSGLPKWPAYDKDTGYQVMHLSFSPHAEPDTERARFEMLDSFMK